MIKLKDLPQNIKEAVERNSIRKPIFINWESSDLTGLFDWKKSREGHSFWNGVQDSLIINTPEVLDYLSEQLKEMQNNVTNV